MKDIFRENKLFLLPYLLFLMIGGIVLAINEKADLHLFLNQYHHPVSDLFFRFITYLGDGYAVVIITIIALFVKYRFAILIGAANIISSLITQGLKHFVFDDLPRPVRFFEGVREIYLVPGVDNYGSFSFPSGHTTAAFTLYLCLALITRHRGVKALLFFLSLAVGFSRVYLSQHFFSDIYAGSIIGVTISLGIYYILERWRRYNELKWLDSALMKRSNQPPNR
jgi:membrane-associated phospholipid phosphatase